MRTGLQILDQKCLAQHNPVAQSDDRRQTEPSCPVKEDTVRKAQLLIKLHHVMKAIQKIFLTCQKPGMDRKVLCSTFGVIDFGRQCGSSGVPIQGAMIITKAFNDGFLDFPSMEMTGIRRHTYS